jgi:hypothetical protein
MRTWPCASPSAAASAFRFQFLVRDHRDHAGQSQGGRRVDPLDDRVRIRTADERRVQHPPELKIIDVL